MAVLITGTSRIGMCCDVLSVDSCRFYCRHSQVIISRVAAGSGTYVCTDRTYSVGGQNQKGEDEYVGWDIGGRKREDF